MHSWKRSLIGAVAGCLLACSNGGGPNQSRGSGSLALSNDDQYAYAADTDNGILAVIDTKSKTVVDKVAVGKLPARVAVGPDETIYVTNRGDRSLSVIKKGSWVEAARVSTAVEPTGLAVSQDGKTIYVVNGASNEDPQVGTLQAIDAQSLQTKWELPVGSEPRGIALVANNRAVISLLKEGTLVEVDLTKGTILNDKIDVYQQANANKLNGTTNPSYGYSSVPYSSFKARSLSTVTSTPNGDRVFVPGVWAREDKIDRRPTTAGGYYNSGGPCNLGSVASPALITADTTTGVEPKVDDLTDCFNNGSNTVKKDFPPSVVAPKNATGTGSDLVLQGPSAAAVDSTGSFLYVVNREGQTMAVIPAYTRQGQGVDYTSNGSTVQSIVSIGKGADGVALSNDGSKAYVYSQFDHKLQIFKQGKDDTGQYIVMSDDTIPVAEDTLSPDLVQGRKMFYDARDSRLSAPTTNVACSSCHIDARDDGHVWNFPDGPRQTPSLAGRFTMQTGPWHWSGEFTSLDDFYNHTIRERMGGSGLTSTATGQIKQWLDTVDGPDKVQQRTQMTDVEAHGLEVFNSAGCNTCHSGENLESGLNANVGSIVTGGLNPDNGVVVSKGFNVPSLRSVSRTAPFMHDGSVKTLEARVFNNPSDQHGTTSNLSDDDKTALVAYLKTL